MKRLGLAFTMLLLSAQGEVPDGGLGACVSNRNWFWDPAIGDDCEAHFGPPRYTGSRWFDSATGECRPTCESTRTDKCFEPDAGCAAEGLYRTLEECEQTCIPRTKRTGCS